MTDDCVRFQVGVHVGGLHTPESAHVGGGGGGGGAHPPGGCEQCATAAMAFTTPPHGSPRVADESVHDAFPRQVAFANAANVLSLHVGDGLKDGHAPVGVPKKAVIESMTPLSQTSDVSTTLRSELYAQKGLDGAGCCASAAPTSSEPETRRSDMAAMRGLKHSAQTRLCGGSFNLNSVATARRTRRLMERGIVP